MAQRLLHYLFGLKIAEQIQLKDETGFLLGNVLPDAAPACDRDKAHFKTKTDSHVYYDFAAFRNRYCEQMMQDDLYLGYYMHLVEDAFYRAFIYSGRFRMPGSPEEVRRLYEDYRALNARLVSRYGMVNRLGDGTDAADETIPGVATFSVRGFLMDMTQDFTMPEGGNTVFLTEMMADEFVETYLPPAIDEAKRARVGESVLDARGYAWLRKK